jgi:predicted mannosyl-3-phosphoglycerate phosphatase (HAD superfamily)
VYASASVSSMLEHAARSRLKATSSLCISQTQASQTLWERDEDELTSSIETQFEGYQVDFVHPSSACTFWGDCYA